LEESCTVASESSFDIVSKVDRQEVANAINQSQREIAQRYDFKNVGAAIEWSGERIEMHANSEGRVVAVLDVFKEKLIKRGISLKALQAGDPQASGKEYKILATVDEGISTDNAKKIAKIIRDEGPKGVQAQIQGDQLRVSSKKKDDLQRVISLLKDRDKDFDFAIQFTNYR
jgi:cyclic-di-GMP-binding protein